MGFAFASHHRSPSALLEVLLEQIESYTITSVRIQNDCYKSPQTHRLFIAYYLQDQDITLVSKIMLLLSQASQMPE